LNHLTLPVAMEPLLSQTCRGLESSADVRRRIVRPDPPGWITSPGAKGTNGLEPAVYHSPVPSTIKSFSLDLSTRSQAAENPALMSERNRIVFFAIFVASGACWNSSHRIIALSPYLSVFYGGTGREQINEGLLSDQLGLICSH